MNIHEILKQLPHRYPILLVDRVLEIEKGVSIRALKNVSINEPFFLGHTLGVTPDADTVYYFAGIDGARFKRPVEPGDQLILEVKLDRTKAGIYKFKAKALVGTDVAAEADLMCTMKKIR